MLFSMAGKNGICVSFITVYIYSGELFPTVVRNTGVGTSSMLSRVGVMLSPVLVTIVSFVNFKFHLHVDG